MTWIRHDFLASVLTQRLKPVRLLVIALSLVGSGLSSSALLAEESTTEAADECGRDAVAESLKTYGETYGENANEMTLKFGHVDVPAENFAAAREEIDALSERCPSDTRIEAWRFRLAQEHSEAPDAWALEVVDAYLDSRSDSMRPGRSSAKLGAAQVLVERGLQLARAADLMDAERAKPFDEASLEKAPPSFHDRIRDASERTFVDYSIVAGQARLGLGQIEAAKADIEKATTDFKALDPQSHGKSLLPLHERLSTARTELGLPAFDAPEVADTKPSLPGFGEVEEPLPVPFNYGDLTEKNWTVVDFQGQATVVSLWATWCVPCRVELEEAQKLHEELKDVEGLQVLSFNVDEDPSKVADFVEKRGWTFPVVMAQGLLEKGQTLLPQTWRIDPQAMIRYKAAGFDTEEIGKWPTLQKEALEALRQSAPNP